MRCIGQFTDRICWGPSNNETSSPSTQNSTQTTTAGDMSPNLTNNGNGKIVYNPPEVSLSALANMADIVTKALQGAGQVASGALGSLNATQEQVAEAGAAQANQNAQLLSQVLESQQALATAQGTGGASLTYETNNKIIIGLLVLAGAAVVGLFFWKK